MNEVDEKAMTPQEVWAHIDSQPNWSNENKLAAWQTYTAYLRAIPFLKDPNTAKRAEELRNQLTEWGLKV